MNLKQFELDLAKEGIIYKDLLEKPNRVFYPEKLDFYTIEICYMNIGDYNNYSYFDLENKINNYIAENNLNPNAKKYVRIRMSYDYDGQCDGFTVFMMDFISYSKYKKEHSKFKKELEEYENNVKMNEQLYRDYKEWKDKVNRLEELKELING